MYSGTDGRVMISRTERGVDRVSVEIFFFYTVGNINVVFIVVLIFNFRLLNIELL